MTPNMKQQRRMCCFSSALNQKVNICVCFYPLNVNPKVFLSNGMWGHWLRISKTNSKNVSKMLYVSSAIRTPYPDPCVHVSMCLLCLFQYQSLLSQRSMGILISKCKMLALPRKRHSCSEKKFKTIYSRDYGTCEAWVQNTPSLWPCLQTCFFFKRLLSTQMTPTFWKYLHFAMLMLTGMRSCHPEPHMYNY